MLTLLDCCYGGNIHKSLEGPENPRTYILMSAGHHGRITDRPGPRSFTQALICSLEELHAQHGDDGFSTTELRYQINRKESRENNPCYDSSSLARYRNIVIAPVKKNIASQAFAADPMKSTLLLRLPLKTQNLDQRQIDTLARGFSRVIKDNDLPVKSIEWTRLQPCALSMRTTARVMGVVQVWKRRMTVSGHPDSTVNSSAGLQRLPQHMADSSAPVPPEPDAQPRSKPVSSARKRNRHDSRSVSDDKNSSSRRRYSQSVTLQIHAGLPGEIPPLTPKSEEDMVGNDAVEDIGENSSC